MKITSTAFDHEGTIPPQYTCDGNDTSPPLSIEGVPDDAQSLVLIVEDPDAPAGTWVHWTVWNIDPTTDTIEADSVPDGATEGITSFGNVGYGGPCPPSGAHRYYFRLSALDVELDIGSDADVATLRSAMEKHILDEAELMARYRR